MFKACGLRGLGCRPCDDETESTGDHNEIFLEESSDQRGVIVVGEKSVGKSTFLYLLVHMVLPPNWPEKKLKSTGAGKIPFQPLAGCCAEFYDFQGIQSPELLRPFMSSMRVILLCVPYQQYTTAEPDWFKVVERLALYSHTNIKVIRVVTCCDNGEHGDTHYVPAWDPAAKMGDVFFVSAKHDRGVDRVREYLINLMPATDMAGIIPQGQADYAAAIVDSDEEDGLATLPPPTP